MGLSRLENFIKNINGTTLYVDPNNLDSTDSIENQGNSPTRPFKTLQRALLEAVRFSYISGFDNDRFEHTKISLSSGTHYIDNRPGIIPDWNTGDPPNYVYRNISTDSSFGSLDYLSNFDITDPLNVLYKFNSIHGGVIIPRGVSVIGEDIKKTKIRPLYVPYPYEITGEDDIELSAIFRITGGTLFRSFTILDADSKKYCYYNYSNSLALPTFSHHKLRAFEYADGVNVTSITYNNSSFSTNRTELEIYYDLISIAFGVETNRSISPDYPSTSIDIQPRIDEYRIVGSRGEEVGISSIYAGDGITSSTTITVILDSETEELDVDTPIQIQGITGLDQFSKYNGQFLVSAVVSTTQIEYKVENAPADPSPSAGQLASATLSIISDTVTSASPYISDISLRSVYGMSGLHVDGSKVSGFKSAVVAQFTGISLQKDDNAFVLYNPVNGAFEDNTTVDNLYSNSKAVFKPDYKNFHIKVSNGGYSQIVSIFAIGYAEHFVTDSGGDISVENSSSNFGAKALVSTGFRSTSFNRDDVGYLTHIISPKEIDEGTVTIEFTAIDVIKTKAVANQNRLYLLGESNSDVLPESTIEGYRIGAKEDDYLNVYLGTQKYSARIIMGGTTEVTSKKSYKVKKKLNGISNSIVSNIIELESVHDFQNGETVRIISDTGELPDGISSNQFYYVITAASGDPTLNSTKIKLAQSLNDANSSYTNSPEIDIYSNETSNLTVVSKVSDKKSGDIGHPVQWDSTQSNWYISVATGNLIYPAVVASTFDASSRSFIERQQDTRSILDTIYRFRYVIPKDANINARSPLDGFILQDSGSVVGTTAEIGKYFTINPSTLSNSTDIRNPRFVANASWSTGVATFTSELPHELTVGTEIEVKNVISSLNTAGEDNKGYNGTCVVTNVPSPTKFDISLVTDPGTFNLNQVLLRGLNLPNFRKVKLDSTYIVYRAQEVKPYIKNQQDGVYHLVLVNSSYSPKDAYFDELKFQQPIQNLYPQTNRDNPDSDPGASRCFSVPFPIGHVITNDPEKSITKETLIKSMADLGVGIGITYIVSSSDIAHTIYTEIDHGLNRITELTLTSPGAGYGNGTAGLVYNAVLTGSGAGEGATAVLSVNPSGNIIDIRVMNGGSSYAVGNVLNIVGVATTVGFTTATATVTRIYDNIGDCINVDNVLNGYDSYNGQYKITGITTGDTRKIVVGSALTVYPYSTAGFGVSYTQDALVNVVGKTLSSTIQYNNISGIGTVTTAVNHGLHVNKKVVIGGANSSFYNGDRVVKNIINLTKFEVDFGTNPTVPATTGSIYVYPSLFTSNGGNISKSNENVSGRLIPFYGNITSTLISAISSGTISIINITNATKLGLEVGDYLQIDDEIVRIKTSVTSDAVEVYRGLLGTARSIHASGSVVTRIKPKPIEFRRTSITKASSHKFEHVGFGPGNYSTALPDKQDRKLSEVEELLAHKTSIDGGLIVFAGMDDTGDYYLGNKKVNSATGEEKSIDSPVPSTTGEEIDIGGLDVGFDVLTPLEVSISRSINVEGGNDRNIISKFNGPVIFNNKVTSNSEKGIEAISLYLQGDADISRKYTVGIQSPSYPGNYGDIVYNATPLAGGTIGWVYTQADQWETFGPISNNNVVPSNSVGVAVNGVPLGASTNINLVGTGAAQLSGSYASGTSTITLNVTSGAGVFSDLVVAGLSTFNLLSKFNNGLQVLSGSSSFAGPVTINSTLGVSGALTVPSITTSGTITAQTINVQNINNTGIVTFSGDMTAGSLSRTANTFMRSLSGDSNTAGFQAYGPTSGTGYLFVGRTSQRGGGVAFNGNILNPFSIGEILDTVQFYRTDSGTRISVFSYPYNSSIVSFNDSINVNGSGVFLTPNAGSTGGVVIRANGTTNKNYLQFTNNAQTTQWGVAEVNSSGSFIWSGKLQSNSVEATSATLTNVNAGILTATQINGTFNGAGIIPVGGIIMWYGSSDSNPVVVDGITYPGIPANWAICSGQTVNGLKTPDLRERFIVGAGGDNSTVPGTTGYTVHSVGGQNNVTLTTNQIPVHNHTTSLKVKGVNGVGAGFLPDTFLASHSVDVPLGPTSTEGGGTSHENRPPYYALAFIMRIA